LQTARSRQSTETPVDQSKGYQVRHQVQPSLDDWMREAWLRYCRVYAGAEGFIELLDMLLNPGEDREPFFSDAVQVRLVTFRGSGLGGIGAECRGWKSRSNEGFGRFVGDDAVEFGVSHSGQDAAREDAQEKTDPDHP